MTKGVGATFSLCCYEEVVVCPSLNKNIFFPPSSAISLLEELVFNRYLTGASTSASDTGIFP